MFRERFEVSYPAVRGKRVLLFAGRVVREKNLGFLITILPGILAKHPECVLVIAGAGPDLGFFRREAAGAGLSEQCIFTGYLERSELALLYTIAEVFVFPSLTDTQGLVTLEAMISGVPVVAIGALGTLMVMGGDIGGFMVQNDTAEFTAKVLRLLDDPELYRQKAAEARVHAQSWSIVEVTKRLVEIYRSTVDAHSADYGEPRTPVWELLMNKRWWKINNKIFQKKTRQKWQQIKNSLK
jgi:glycosyltransferase involved in cell wall biosynthesis